MDGKALPEFKLSLVALLSISYGGLIGANATENRKTIVIISPDGKHITIPDGIEFIKINEITK